MWDWETVVLGLGVVLFSSQRSLLRNLVLRSAELASTYLLLLLLRTPLKKSVSVPRFAGMLWYLRFSIRHTGLLHGVFYYFFFFQDRICPPLLLSTILHLGTGTSWKQIKILVSYGSLALTQAVSYEWLTTGTQTLSIISSFCPPDPHANLNLCWSREREKRPRKLI